MLTGGHAYQFKHSPWRLIAMYAFLIARIWPEVSCQLELQAGRVPPPTPYFQS